MRTSQAYDRASGRLAGIVTEVADAVGGTHTLRLRLAPTRADVAEGVLRFSLLPFVEEMVPLVDVAGGRMEVGCRRHARPHARARALLPCRPAPVCWRRVAAQAGARLPAHRRPRCDAEAPRGLPVTSMSKPPLVTPRR